MRRESGVICYVEDHNERNTLMEKQSLMNSVSNKTNRKKMYQKTNNLEVC